MDVLIARTQSPARSLSPSHTHSRTQSHMHARTHHFVQILVIPYNGTFLAMTSTTHSEFFIILYQHGIPHTFLRHLDFQTMLHDTLFCVGGGVSPL